MTFLDAGEPDGSHHQTLGSLLQIARDLLNHVAMFLALGLGGLALNALLFRDRLVPRWLSLWGLVATTLALGASVAVFIGALVVVSPLYLGLNPPLVAQELVFALMLIGKGLDPPSGAAASPEERAQPSLSGAPAAAGGVSPAGGDVGVVAGSDRGGAP